MFGVFRFLFREVGVRKFFTALFRLPSYFNLFRGLLADPRVPLFAKAMLAAAAIYAVTPLNFLNFIPVIGEVEDITLLWMAGKWFLSLCPPEVLKEHEIACGLAPSPASRRA